MSSSIRERFARRMLLFGFSPILLQKIARADVLLDTISLTGTRGRDMQHDVEDIMPESMEFAAVERGGALVRENGRRRNNVGTAEAVLHRKKYILNTLLHECAHSDLLFLRRMVVPFTSARKYRSFPAHIY